MGKIEVEFMWFENVVVILTWFILTVIYIKTFFRNRKVLDIVLLVMNVASAIIYYVFNFINLKLNSMIQILIILFMYIVPFLKLYLNQHDIYLKQKIIYYLGKIYYDMGRYDIAIRLYMHSIKTNKKSATSNNYYILGRCLRKEKRYQEARDAFIEATQLDKNNFMAYYELGLTLGALGKKDTAIVMYSNCLKINEDFKGAKIALAITYSEIGRVKEAVSIYNELIEKKEEDEEVLYNLANIYYYELEDVKEAENCYMKATEKNNKLYAAWYNLGIINYLKGDYENSIKYLKIARQEEMFKNKAEYSLAKSYMAIKENKKAEKILLRLTKDDETYLDKIKNEIIFEEILEDIRIKETEN